MTLAEKRQQAVAAVASGNPEAALQLLSSALGEMESSEIWNDWAVAQFQLKHFEDAEEGFRRALELDGKNSQALVNLGVLLRAMERWQEAAQSLEDALPELRETEQQIVSSLIKDCRDKYHDNARQSEHLEDYLIRFVSADRNEQIHFKTHLRHYVEALELLPQAVHGDTLLELGAGFFHLTPALSALKGYKVRCSGFWEGHSTRKQRVTSFDGAETHEFEVNNFDVEAIPWPYASESFDVVVCCEMIEHLIHDPMAVVAEINRVLKSGGRLLLTTPNVASLRSIQQAMLGRSPYIFGKYEIGGKPSGRHNREYSADEVEELLKFGGLTVEHLATRDSWTKRNRSTLSLLAARNLSLARRGENVICLARKTGSVLERYPDTFFHEGVQATRHDHQSASSTAPSVRDTPLNVLFVHEMLPQPDHHDYDIRIMQFLSELVEQGNRVTYLARCSEWLTGHKDDRDTYLKALEDLGMMVMGHDRGKIRFLGKHASTEGTLEQVLSGAKFDLAILMMGFRSSQPIPEHYIPEIRAHSPQTRIAVVIDDIHGLREQHETDVRGCWITAERAAEYLVREFEVYRRADLVLTVTESDKEWLLARAPEVKADVLPMTENPTREHVMEELDRNRLTDLVRRIARTSQTLMPKKYDRHVWSYQLVHEKFPECVNYRPSYNRAGLQLLGHLKLAERFRLAHRPQDALQQLRYALNAIKDSYTELAITPYLLRKMSEGYRASGNSERAALLEHVLDEARPSTEQTLPRPHVSSGGKRPELSVIISTFNGIAQLQACFPQLAAQSLHPDRWELIVVDDGSNDGTERLCRELPKFCNFEYVFQAHAGMGAARQAGALKACGDILLFLSDDTIPSRNLLEAHLRAQYALGEEKTVICGPRGLPEGADRRALTHFGGKFPMFFASHLETGGLREAHLLAASNLSVRREALLAAGSFDPEFETCDDIELGMRLHKADYRIQWENTAHADYNLLRLTIPDIISKARQFGRAQVQLFRKYPNLAEQGAGVFGRLTDADLGNLRESLAHAQGQMREWTTALERLDQCDLHALCQASEDPDRRFREIMQTTGQAVVAVFRFHYLESFLRNWPGEAVSSISNGLAMNAYQ